MLQDPNVERYVQEAIKPLRKEIKKQGKLIEILSQELCKHHVSGHICSFYMAGMDTSGKCSNCGKNQWEH